ncbi:unnamed protein product [Moneuplotes crassus]|uniref:Uncharacterized protein n=1 Tax=Euplotes crassus TaxID=5936 RepID=A0AAD1UEU1_EUPCR|nr:unnamed protein product [Moneuplotes crassus]
MSDSIFETSQGRKHKRSVFIKQNMMLKTHQRFFLSDRKNRRSIAPVDKDPLSRLNLSINRRVLKQRTHKNKIRRCQQSCEPHLDFQKDWRNATFHLDMGDASFANESQERVSCICRFERGNNFSIVKAKCVFLMSSSCIPSKTLRWWQYLVNLEEEGSNLAVIRSKKFSPEPSFSTHDSQESRYDYARSLQRRTQGNNFTSTKYYFSAAPKTEDLGKNLYCVNVKSYLNTSENAHQMHKRIGQQIRNWKFNKNIALKAQKRPKISLKPLNPILSQTKPKVLT